MLYSIDLFMQIQMDHLQDELRTIESFKSTFDRALDPPDERECERYYSIIIECTKSHGKCPSSYDVSPLDITIIIL